MTKATDQKPPGATEVPTAEQLVRENIGWMLGLAERLVNDRSLAEDIVQDALINALRNLEGFQGRSSLRSWLHRIVVNAALSKLRQMKRLAEEPIDDLLPEFDHNDCRIEAKWSTLVTADEVIEKADLKHRVLDSMSRLPDSYRIILQLRDLEGYDTAEVANILEISESNAKIRLHRARAALKKLLEPILRGEER